MNQPLQQHPLSAAFPAMSVLELGDLTNDIRANGQRHPIVLLDGLVLDGWHRAQACFALGREPATAPLTNGVDPVAYVQSVNLHRRHLTGSQRAAAVVACNDWAKDGNQPIQTPGIRLATNGDMAKAADVHPSTIKAAKRALEAGLGDAVRDGKVSAKQAAGIAALPEPERQAALEAPPAPKAMPKPKGDVGNPRIDVLERMVEAKDAEIADLLRKLEEAGAQVQELHEDLTAARTSLDAEDLLIQFEKEIVAVGARARAAESRVRGLTIQVKDLQHMAKVWKRKAETLEKKLKGQPVTESEPEPELEQVPA